MRLLFLYLVAISFLFAKSYQEIRFEGLVRLSDLSATELIGFGAGDEVDDERINQALRRLFEQGYFTDIAVDEPEPAVLRFTFTEKPAIAGITFKGISETERDEKYLPVFAVKKGEIYDLRRIEAAKMRLIEMARAEGYYDTLVEIEPRFENESVYLEVSLHKGQTVTIRQSRFEGLSAFEKDEIQKDLANREAQSFSWFFGRSDGKLRLLELPYDSARLRDFYLEHGYLDVEVSEPFLLADFDTYSATLDYTLQEGEPYGVSSVEIAVLDNDADLSGLKETLRLQPMQRFNIKRMRTDIGAIREAAANEGYAYARVTPDLRKDEAKRTVALSYRVEYGKKVYIRDVIVSGNSRTLDRVVRREIFLAPGDLYNLTDLKESRAALGRLGFFENAEIEERRVSENEMDLVISVKETSTGSLMVGGGYSSYDGFILNASISDRNLFGSGYSYGFELDTSSKTRRFELSLTNPRVRDGDYSLSFSLYDTHYEALTYTRDSQGFSVSSGRKLGRYWRGSLSGAWSKNNNIYEEPTQFYVNGETTKLSLTPSLSFNDTDDYFIPRKGSVFSQSLEFAGFGQNEEYTKSTTSFSWYKGLEPWLEYDLILRYRARLQAADADINDVSTYPIGSRIFLGGVRSLRGYQSSSVAPLLYDENGNIERDSNGDPRYLGGTLAFNQSIEASIPLIADAKMRMAFFYDFGAIGVDDLEVRRSSYGAALEWISPMGPLMFIWAWPLDDKPYDETSTFEFTLGQRF
ncbi:MAG: outer membrane protein assembly factor BamA [Campylobacterales bacterium]